MSFAIAVPLGSMSPCLRSRRRCASARPHHPKSRHARYEAASGTRFGPISKRSPPMAKPPANIAASVRARLLNLARRTNPPFDVLLPRFVPERLLYRLSRSPHDEHFVLMGAMLPTTWLPDPDPCQRDIHPLGFGN